MFGIGPMELMLILVVALLVLGPKRMPDLARTLGRGLGEFRRASNDLRQSLALDEIQNELRDGLTGSGTIHKPVKQPVKKPDADDKPAQAGDELVAGEGAKPDKHPGELPDALDPHAHHDEGEGEGEGTGKGDTANAREDAEPAAPTASAADSDLGAVPVGQTVTPRRTAETDGTGEERG
jgi:Tat protein translocase TatB subunit